MKPEVRYGLFASLPVAALFMVSGFVDGFRSTILSYAELCVLCFAIVFAVREIRERAGSVTFGRIVGIGMLTIIISGAAAAPLIYIYLKFFNHDLIANARVQNLDWIESVLGNMTKEQRLSVEQNENLVVSPGSIALASIIGNCLPGLLISLVLGATMRRDRNTAPPADY